MVPASTKNSLSSAAAFAQYGMAFSVCALTAALALLLHDFLDDSNIVMLFLLAVFFAAIRMGRGPAVMASFLAVALFDFFFVLPKFSFSIADAQYLVTFAVMLAVGLVTAQLVSRLGEQTREARSRELETRQLYEVAREMAGAHALQQVLESASRYLDERTLGVNLLLTTDTGELRDASGGHHPLSSMETGFARSAYQRNEIVEADSLAGIGMAIVFVPLRAAVCTRGVLAVTPRTDDTAYLRSQRRALEGLASITALAVERLHFAEVSQRTELLIAEERLRTSVLASLSHDLRTPLTTLVGLADALAQRPDRSPVEVAETAGILRDQARSMHRLLSDLLDMARLTGTGTPLRREWQPLEDVVGSSLRLIEGAAGNRPVDVDLPQDLPLVHLDAVLIERVLCNLLENAFKYSPPGARVTLSARRLEDVIRISVCNDGPGFPPDRLEKVFDLFVRGHDEPSIPGVGLGLAICKAILVAHGGSIRAENHSGGACVHITFPCDTPPIIEEEAETI